MNVSITKRLVLSLSVVGILLLICSCSPKITANITKDGNATVTFACQIPDILSSLSESLTGTDMKSLISTDEIKANMIRNNIPVISCSLNAANQFVLETESLSPTVLPIPVTTKKHSIILTFSPEVIQDIVSLLPPETVDTFDLLLAPVLTGERMTPEEYVELIGVMYGGKVAAELENAKLTLELHTPENPDLTVEGARKNVALSAMKKYLSYDFSVVNILTMENPVTITICF